MDKLTPLACWPAAAVAGVWDPSGEAAAAAAPLARPRWGFLLTRKNLALSALTLVVHAAAIGLHTAATGFTYARGVEVYGRDNSQPPLRDVLHDLLPNTQRWRVVPEVGHLLPVLALAWSMLSHIDQRSLDCFRLFLWCHAALMATRAASFSLTLLPDASQQCHSSLFIGSCHDLMFSGHAMITTLAALVLQHFFTLPRLGRWLMWANNVGVYVLIVTSHNHYTVDVVTGVVLAFGVFLGFSRHPWLLQWAAVDPLHVMLRGDAAAALLCAVGGERRRLVFQSADCDCSGYADDAAFASWISPQPFVAGDGGGGGGEGERTGAKARQRPVSRPGPAVLIRPCAVARCSECCAAAALRGGGGGGGGGGSLRIGGREALAPSSAPERGARQLGWRHRGNGVLRHHACCSASHAGSLPGGWLGERHASDADADVDADASPLGAASGDDEPAPASLPSTPRGSRDASPMPPP